MRKVFLIFGIAAITLMGCKNVEKNEVSTEGAPETPETVNSNITEVDSHNSENSLDWAGVYEGTTPCADCSGIKTVLDLRKDKTFILSQTYLGKPAGENEFTQTGNFVWDRAGKMIRLKTESGAFQYDVGENKLWMLDVKRNRIEGDLADMYILKKQIQ